MALDTDFNVNPYYDDYDADKKFLRMLFKPGYAVQARELTQLQTILQKQVDRFGQHIFKNGSVVTGGQTVFQNTAYINVATTYSSTDVNIDEFDGQIIVDNISVPTKKAQVIKVFDSDSGTGDPKTLLVSQLFGTFTDGDTIATYSSSPSFANISTSGTGTGQTFSVNSGVFYYDGFFIQNDAQTVAVSKYTQTGNARIGFEITESIVESTADTSLLDPALEASNYQAPGSDRYKIDLTLATRSLESTDDTQFIELARIENGALTKYVKYPLYSVLEDTLARRTYDESGNYTVRPFKLTLQTNSSNTANLDVILSPGKAYVYGYEFETIAPTTITVEKPRQFESVNNKRITADYGYYVFANTLYGSFPINSLQTVDLHCISGSTINATTTGTISNTKIGTARVKSIEFDSSTDTSNTATYSYKLFLTDISVGSIAGGNCNTGIAAGNTSYVQIANTLAGTLLYSTANNAYTGAKLRITAGPGLGESSKTITNYNGATQTIKLLEPFSANLNTQSTFSIDFDFGSTESFVVTSSTTRVAAADVDPRSRDAANPYYSSFISDSTSEPLIFAPGESFIKEASITDMSFSYRRLYALQTFSSSQSPALTVGTGESLTTATSTSAKQLNYQIIVTSQGTGAYAVGQTVPATAITSVDTSTRKITITNANNMTANIIATIDVSSPTQKNKTYVAANTTIQTSGGNDLFSNGQFVLYGPKGQLQISANAMSTVRTQDARQSLYTSDVVSLNSVIDMNGLAINPANEISAINVTSRYTLVTGQKDSYYDHAAIKLKPGQPAPVGPLIVKFNQFVSSGAGFFDVTSYTSGGYAYEDIPSYMASNGIKYELRDVLDFRPVRANAVPGSASSTNFDVDSTTTGPKIPENGSDIIIDYSYYLPRNDKVVLNKDKTFNVVKGDSSLTPIDPPEKDGGMTLYVLRNEAYLKDSANSQVQYIDNKRYTMKDIGAIEQRVTNLEYYTSLSLLEQTTLSKSDLTTLDSANLPRFKNGILVDSFKGSSVADVFKNDYVAAIDRQNFEMRPTFNISPYSLTFDSANSSGFTQNGAFITVSSTVESFIDQPKASKVVNINPFNVVNYLGKIELNPKQDIWIDTTRKPDVLVNLNGDLDAWQYIIGNPTQYEWNSWETISTGTSVQQAQWIGGGGRIARIGFDTITTVTNQTRTGVASTVVPQSITQTLGDRVVDLSIVPYMRSTSVLFTGSDFKPSTTLYPFFDKSLVETYTARANKFTLARNNLGYQVTTGNYELANVYNNATATVNGVVTLVKTSNNQVFIANPTSITSGFNLANANLVGQTSGTTYHITGYDHYSGFVNTANTTSITLSLDAASANNIADYNSSTIFIVAGEGAGQSRTISTYNPATRVAMVSSAFTTTPIAANSVYSIGRLTTTAAGDIAGVYTVPASTFRVGEKQFRLIDNSSNDVGGSSTNGDTSFFAQGLVQTVRNDVISATVPTIQRQVVTDNRVLTTVTQGQARVVGWIDPLAETFLVSPGTYPNGIFINRARFCFKTKDATVPVTCQIRPTVNGYPSYSVIYPYATATLTPDKVQTTNSPDLNDATKYTEFIFDTPVYVQPGEHSFVLLSNSNQYEVYAAEIGALDLVTGRQISEQPYGGSLFLSQNGSTWTADQNSDMMFRLFRSQFSQSPATATFQLSAAPSANVPYDLVNLATGDLAIGSTSITYNLNTVANSSGVATGYLPITAKENYEMPDGYGRRVLNSARKDSFKVRATMTTTDSAVSPVIDATRMNILVVENIINDLPLSNNDIVVASGGSGYSSPTVTISGGGGSGATAAATESGGAIVSVYLTNAGSGYTSSPTITVSGGGGSGASVIYNGEDKKSGGNSNVRYITRKITLTDGFDSGDLRVYLTAYKPSGSNIYVYYKLLASSDTDNFDDKNYQLMTQLDNTNFVSTSATDYRELTFAPGINNSANNSVSYTSGSTTFNTFKSFAIKIVLTGTDTISVPKVRDFRSIALPEGTV